MLLRKLGRLALASAAALLSIPPPTLAKDSPEQSTFVSDNGEVAFALTVADDNQLDLYFAIRAKSHLSWAAVGLGSHDMPGALYLIIYKNERGDNVTFSPRVAYGHYEPAYYDKMEYDVLEGSVDDEYMTFKAKCTKHCRSWPAYDSSGGTLDVSSPDQAAIFAYGPKEGYHSDLRDAPLKYHTNYGVFNIDVKRTKGSDADDLALTDKSETDGAEGLSFRSAKGNWKSPLHGVVMILCIAVLLPAGVVLLRTGGSVKWHALNQVIATVGALLASALGIVNSFYYQRSRKFDSTHQIIGFVVVGLLLVQFGLGFVHHMQYKKTQTPTKYGRIHLWVGRIILFFGVLNCFVGFTFAVNRQYGMILAALVLFITFGGLLLIAGKGYLDKKKQRLHGAQEGFNRPPEPWRQQPTPQYAPAYHSDPPPGYEPPSHQIGLGPMSPVTPWRQAERKDDEDLDLGTQHRPREFT